MLAFVVCLQSLSLGLVPRTMTAVFGLCRSQASLALLPVDVWSSLSTQAGLTLDDKCAVRTSSASLRRLVNAATTKVGAALLLADLPLMRPGQRCLKFALSMLFTPTYNFSHPPTTD